MLWQTFLIPSFYGFSVDGDYDKAYENIFIKNRAMYFSEFYNYVNSTEETNCLPLDAHWNHLGNQVAGNTLSKLLVEVEY